MVWALTWAGCQTARPSPGPSAPDHEHRGAGAAQGDSPGGAGETARPRLVVLVIVDQLPSWSFERDRAIVRGGFARLLREGVYFARADIPYAITYTAPGHASLGTGAPPSITHILANSWYVPASGKSESAVVDPGHPIFLVGTPVPGRDAEGKSKAGASPSKLMAEGVADMLRQATSGRGKSVSISLKDRSAVLMLGKKPDIAVWYQAEQLAMTTSRYYVDAPPAWLVALAAEHPVAPWLDAVWEPLASVNHAAVTGIADATPGEQAEYGMGHVFPYRAARSENPGGALLAMPFGDDMVMDAALRAIDALELGKDDVPDLLGLSFSAHDYAGHNWGQESWERLDLLLRLDDKLGKLLEFLDARLGSEGYAVILTSDHGATRLVEHSQRAGKKAWRIKPEEVARKAQEAAASVLGQGEWVAHVSAATLHVTPAFAGRRADEQEAAFEAMTTAIAAMPGMGYVARIDRIAGDCDRRAGLEARACRSVVLGLSGQIIFFALPDSLVTPYREGTSHGSPHPDDSTVPIIVAAPGWAPRRVDGPVSQLQVAPTVARLLGVPAPPSAQAPALSP